MVLSFKTRMKRERIRRKYAAKSPISAEAARERRVKTRPPRLREIKRGPREPLKKQPKLKDMDKQKLLSEIHLERHPDKLEEKLNMAKKAGIDAALMAEDMKRHEKTKKARERMIENVRKMRHREASANEKDAIQKMKSGHSEEAMKDLKQSGLDGGIGNVVAHSEREMAEDMKTLSKETGKHFDSVMQKTLKDHSVPADSMNQAKKKDKSDQNLEEKKVNLSGSEKNESTQHQMVMNELRKRRGRG